MSNILVPNKYSKISKKRVTIHCRHNSTKLKVSLSCKKCLRYDKRFTKTFFSTSSLYQHLLYAHSGVDRNEYPSRNKCISELQKISDSMVRERIET